MNTVLNIRYDVIKQHTGETFFYIFLWVTFYLSLTCRIFSVVSYNLKKVLVLKSLSKAWLVLLPFLLDKKTKIVEEEVFELFCRV